MLDDEDYSYIDPDIRTQVKLRGRKAVHSDVTVDGASLQAYELNGLAFMEICNRHETLATRITKADFESLKEAAAWSTVGAASRHDPRIMRAAFAWFDKHPNDSVWY